MASIENLRLRGWGPARMAGMALLAAAGAFLMSAGDGVEKTSSLDGSGSTSGRADMGMPAGPAAALNSAGSTPAEVQPSALVLLYHLDFKNGQGGWKFYASTAFDVPYAVYESGKLKLNAQGSSNCFGYWESPAIPVNGLQLYHVVFKVSAYTDNREECPQFRLRVTATNPSDIAYQAESMLVVNSTGTGSFSPTTDPRVYDVYFRSPSYTQGVKMEFDLLSFDGVNDNPNVSVRLEEVWLELVN